MDNYHPEHEPGERARIGKRVRFWRKKAKMTLNKAAENTGVSRQEFQGIESGQRPMLLEEAALFASAINGLKTDDLANGCWACL